MRSQWREKAESRIFSWKKLHRAQFSLKHVSHAWTLARIRQEANSSSLGKEKCQPPLPGMDERHVYDRLPLQGQSLLHLQLCRVPLQVLGEHLRGTGGDRCPQELELPTGRDTGVRTTFSFSQLLQWWIRKMHQDQSNFKMWFCGSYRKRRDWRIWVLNKQ